MLAVNFLDVDFLVAYLAGNCLLLQDSLYLTFMWASVVAWEWNSLRFDVDQNVITISCYISYFEAKCPVALKTQIAADSL